MTLDDDAVDFSPRPEGRPRNLLGPMFWVWLASCAVCIVLGSLVGLYGSRIFPPQPVASADPGTAPRAAAVEPAVAAPPASTAPPTPVTSAETAALSARIDRLEMGHHALVDAASAALAAASLSQASDSGRPFVGELDMLSRVLPDSRDIAGLRPLAERGAPTRAVLVAEFPEMARQAAIASRTPPDGAGVFARISHALNALFTVRRTDHLTGNDPDAVLARAERRVNDGDLDTAVRELDALPARGQAAARVWLERARSRMEIQRRVAAIRIQALRGLAAASREAGQ